MRNSRCLRNDSQSVMPDNRCSSVPSFVGDCDIHRLAEALHRRPVVSKLSLSTLSAQVTRVLNGGGLNTWMCCRLHLRHDFHTRMTGPNARLPDRSQAPVAGASSALYLRVIMIRARCSISDVMPATAKPV